MNSRVRIRTGPRTRVVAPFDLDLENEPWELAVRVDLTGSKARNHFLMGHGEHHVPVAAVLRNT